MIYWITIQYINYSIRYDIIELFCFTFFRYIIEITNFDISLIHNKSTEILHVSTHQSLEALNYEYHVIGYTQY